MAWWKDIVKGMALAFGFLPDPRPPRISDFRDDTDALRSDWRAVGNDLRRAIDKFDRANRENSK